jgi:hypothetical protein
VDPVQAFAPPAGVEATRQIEAAKAEAERAELKGTPMVLVLRAGAAEPVRRLEADEVSVGEVTEALDEALAAP